MGQALRATPRDLTGLRVGYTDIHPTAFDRLERRRVGDAARDGEHALEDEVDLTIGHDDVASINAVVPFTSRGDLDRVGRGVFPPEPAVRPRLEVHTERPRA